MRSLGTSRIWTGLILLLPIPLVLWSGYLVLTVARAQTDLREYVAFIRQLDNVQGAIRQLENETFGLLLATPEPVNEERWQRRYAAYEEEVRRLPEETAAALEFDRLIAQTTGAIGELRAQLPVARNAPPDDPARIAAAIETHTLVSRAVDGLNEMLRRVRDRTRAISEELSTRWASLNLIVLVSCLLAILVVLLLHAYRLSAAALKRAEDERKRFFSLSRDLLCVADFDGRFRQINPAWEETLGYSPDELLNTPYVDFVHPEDRDETLAVAEDLTKGGRTLDFQNRYRSKSGEYRWLAWRATTDMRRRVIYAIALDMTEQKRAERALRDSEARIRAIVEGAVDGIISIDEHGIVESYNPACERIFGYAAEEVIGQNVKLLMPSLYREKHDSHLANYLHSGEKRVIGTEREVAGRRKDGTTFPMRLSISEVRLGERRIFTSIVRDVTDLKRAQTELRDFAARLETSNRELEDFASVASHDLQEPLRKVQAFGDRLKARCADALTEQGRDYLERMQNAATRMQTLINDLLTFSRVTTKAQPFVPVDLGQVVDDVLSDLEVRIEQLGARVEVRPLPTIDADPLQMRQLFQNLLGNALKFHRPDQPPVVRLQAETLAAVSGDPHGHKAGNPRCRLIVADNGIGFDEKYVDRIFSVFQRLHGRDDYEGTGIGLAVCRKIVERHGGNITAQSKLGEGATFIITLPLTQDQTDADA